MMSETRRLPPPLPVGVTAPGPPAVAASLPTIIPPKRAGGIHRMYNILYFGGPLRMISTNS